MNSAKQTKKTVHWSGDINKIAPEICVENSKLGASNKTGKINEEIEINYGTETGFCDDLFKIETRPFAWRKYYPYHTKVNIF